MPVLSSFGDLITLKTQCMPVWIESAVMNFECNLNIGRRFSGLGNIEFNYVPFFLLWPFHSNETTA